MVRKLSLKESHILFFERVVKESVLELYDLQVSYYACFENFLYP